MRISSLSCLFSLFSPSYQIYNAYNWSKVIFLDTNNYNGTTIYKTVLFICCITPSIQSDFYRFNLLQLAIIIIL
jgi:hypothetical protein